MNYMKVENIIITNFSGSKICFTTIDNYTVNAYFKVTYIGDDYYFRADQILITGERMEIQAINIGYYNKLNKGSKIYKDIIGLNVEVVTDKVLINKIEKESDFI